MKRFAVVLVMCVCGSTVWAGGMPEEIRKQIDEHLIGDWKITATVNGETTTARVVTQWTNGGSAQPVSGALLNHARMISPRPR